MDILLTGATGFIGSHVIKIASEKKYNVLAIRRNALSQPKIKLKNNINWISKELSKISKEDIKNSDVLIHLAAHSANVPYDTLENCMHFNVYETLNFFNFAFNSGIRKFVVTGSCFEYGKKGEEYDFIPPDAALFPTQSYPASKAAASLALTQWALEKNVSLTILRLFQVYGEGELKTRLWPSLIINAKNGNDFKMTLGEQIRDFIDVRDVAKIILSEANRQTNNRLTIRNIGSGKPTKLRDFASNVWEELEGKGNILFGEVPYRENEIMRYVPNIELEYIIK